MITLVMAVQLLDLLKSPHKNRWSMYSAKQHSTDIIYSKLTRYLQKLNISEWQKHHSYKIVLSLSVLEKAEGLGVGECIAQVIYWEAQSADLRK